MSIEELSRCGSVVMKRLVCVVQVNPHTHQLKLCDFGSAKVLVRCDEMFVICGFFLSQGHAVHREIEGLQLRFFFYL